MKAATYEFYASRTQISRVTCTDLIPQSTTIAALNAIPPASLEKRTSLFSLSIKRSPSRAGDWVRANFTTYLFFSAVFAFLMKHVQAHQVKTRECIFSTDNRLTRGDCKRRKKNSSFTYFFPRGETCVSVENTWKRSLWWCRGGMGFGGGFLRSHRFSCRNCQINAEINLYVLDYLTETIDEFSSPNFSTFCKRATLKSAPSTLISQPVIKVYFKTFINYYCYFAALSRAASKMVFWALSTTHCARC